MRKQIFLYLFLFAVIIIVYQFMNSKNYVETTTADIAEMEGEIETLEAQSDSLTQVIDQNPCYFSLTQNDKAREVYASRNINPDSLASAIESAVIQKNLPNKDNELVPYAGMSGNMQVNRVQVLNSRYLIAEFTDSTHWGEAIIRYNLKDNGELTFDTLDGIMYPNLRRR